MMKKCEIMYPVMIIILLYLTPLNHADTDLPSIFWDTDNPILQRQYWNEAVEVKIHDRLTFICPNEIIKIRGREVKQGAYANGFYHNLFVKEIPKDMTDLEEACDTSENSTAFFLTRCDKPKKLHYRNIPINVNQAHKDVPVFEYGKDYMFFATSDGSLDSIKPRNTTSKNCTMVFRIHFNTKKEETPIHSCPLFGRKNVCQEPASPKKQLKQVLVESVVECKNTTPRGLNATTTTDKNVIVSWQPPISVDCNITHYSVCYQENLTSPCQEELVPGKQHSLTLCRLTAGQKYFIRVRAHTSEGPGDYSEEVTFKMAQTNRKPDISALKNEEGSSIDGKSIAIGFVIGVVLTILAVVGFWFFVSRIYQKKQKNDEEQKEETIKNNPSFYKGEEEINAVMTLNTGCRESGQNWKLPPVEEENLHLYCSDA